MANRARRRQLERLQLTRQQLREQRLREARRRKRILAGLTAAAVVVVAAAIAGGVLVTRAADRDHKRKVAAAAKLAASQCTFTPSGAATKPASLPPKAKPAPGMQSVTMTTSQGEIDLSLDAAAAPCTVDSFTHLATAGYFDNTPCHRLTTGGLNVLQCGDPGGTGSGGPGYQFADENLPAAGPDGNATYAAGTLAMANAGAGTNGSQFFLVYKNSPLPPNYTVFGTITAGLDVLAKVAAAGVVGGGSDGKPALPVQLIKVSVVARR